MDRRQFLSSAAMLAVSPGVASRFDFQENPLWKPTHGEPDWKHLRSMFPLGHDKVFLNNGTMGITPYPVLMAVQRGFEKIAESGTYPGHTNHLQKAIGDLIGTAPENIAITKNVSEGTNHACWAIPLKRNDEVIITSHEHVGGSLPWINRSQLDGIVLKVIEPGKNAEETLNHVASAITKKTRVIAVPHIPCTIGQIFPVQDICALARSKGIVSCVDGAHPLGMIQFNVEEIGCDYYYGCVHKWALGPIGVGYFYVSPKAMEYTRCTHIAAYSTDGFNMKTSPPDIGKYTPGAQRFSYGTFCSPLYDGALRALELYKQIGPDHIEKRSRKLATLLQEKILEFGTRIEMLTPVEEKSRGCQVGFRIKNSSQTANSDFVNKCREKNIILRYVGESGIDCIRVSTHYYNSEEDISIFTEELKKFLG